MIDHGNKAIAWRDYDHAVRALFAASERSKSFDTRPVHFGHFDAALARRLKDAITAAEVDPFRRDDTTPGFVTAKFDQATITKINKTTRFRALSAAQTWLLCDLLDSIKDEVATCLGSPWRVLSVKSWTTYPSADPFGMYAWHSDGFIPEIFKIMAYCVPLSTETGSVEFKLDGEIVQHRSKEPGAWVLFQNTDIIHRGVPGTLHERVSVEITLSRSAAFDLRPRYPGQNAHWPEYPWIDAVDGSGDGDWLRGVREVSPSPDVEVQEDALSEKKRPNFKSKVLGLFSRHKHQSRLAR